MKVKWFVDSEDYICAEESGETSRIFKCADGIDPHNVAEMFNEAQEKYEKEHGDE